MSYLLDTSFISVLLNPLRVTHKKASDFISALNQKHLFFVSVVAMAELEYGLNLEKDRTGLLKLQSVLAEAKSYPNLEITKDTATTYAKIKAKLALKYIPNKVQKARKKLHGRPEEWIDQSTSKQLGIQENDLWQCAQAVERNLIFITADKKISRIEAAIDNMCTIIVFS